MDFEGSFSCFFPEVGCIFSRVVLGFAAHAKVQETCVPCLWAGYPVASLSQRSQTAGKPREGAAERQKGM